MNIFGVTQRSIPLFNQRFGSFHSCHLHNNNCNVPFKPLSHTTTTTRPFKTPYSRLSSSSSTTTFSTTSFFSSCLPSTPQPAARAVTQTRNMTTAQEIPKVYTELQEDYLECQEFFECLTVEGVQFFVGVPDSLLKDFCAFVSANVPSKHHIIIANEGNAIAAAAGNYLACGKIPLVYLQNSGLGNTANPVVSLAHPEVYGIPMLLLIGWRGEPGKRDEPQHRVQGRLSPNLCQALDIPYSILPNYKEGAAAILKIAFKHMRETYSPYALLVKKNTFSPYQLPQDLQSSPQYSMSREEALSIILNSLAPNDIVVGSTGFLSREIFELREKKRQNHSSDFLTVGSMGHSPAIALGISIDKPDRQIFDLEGDGSIIMHMGTIATIGIRQPKNLKQIILNNGVHDSVGAQPTGAFSLDFTKIAQGCGYNATFLTEDASELEKIIPKLRAAEGPALLEVRIRHGARSDLGRPTQSCNSSKLDFMKFLATPQ